MVVGDEENGVWVLLHPTNKITRNIWGNVMMDVEWNVQGWATKLKSTMWLYWRLEIIFNGGLGWAIKLTYMWMRHACVVIFLSAFLNCQFED